jgi:hypothetical protein
MLNSLSEYHEYKHTSVQIAQAKANGDDTSDLESDLTDEQQKLTTNIATDKSNAGKTSKGAVASSGSTSSATSAASTVTANSDAVKASNKSSVADSTATATAAASSSSAASTPVTQTAANFKELECV